MKKLFRTVKKNGCTKNDDVQFEKFTESLVYLRTVKCKMRFITFIGRMRVCNEVQKRNTTSYFFFTFFTVLNTLCQNMDYKTISNNFNLELFNIHKY